MKAGNRWLSGIMVLMLGIGAGVAGNSLKAQAADTYETTIDQEAQQKLESAMGKMVLAEWTRVKSADDLRGCTTWTPMRLYYDFHDIYNKRNDLSGEKRQLYEKYMENKGYLILDGSSVSSRSELTLQSEDISHNIYTNDNFIELYAKGQGRNGYILYSGQNDKDNDGVPMCKISLNPSRTGYMDVASNSTLRTNESWQDSWSVYPKWNGHQNTVSLFVNLSGTKDPTLRIEQKSNYEVRLYSNTKGYTDDYEEYSMYIGKLTDVTVIQRDITVGEGQTVRIDQNGAVALQAGVTLTVEEGGAAIIQSRFLNQGTIVNHGTLVVMDGGSLQPIYDPGSGSIQCDGGDIVIMSGGRFMSSEALTLTNGASIVNQGIFLMKKSLTLDNSTLTTETGGTTYLGYGIKPSDFMNAGKTTVHEIVNLTVHVGPGLFGSYLYPVYATSLNLKNGGRLVNRGETSIHQMIYRGNSETIREDGGKIYYWN